MGASQLTDDHQLTTTVILAVLCRVGYHGHQTHRCHSTFKTIRCSQTSDIRTSTKFERCQDLEVEVCVSERPLGCKVRLSFSCWHKSNGIDTSLCRHFVKNDLPRIRYANPRLEIEVDKIPKTKEESWKPEMTVELRACLRFVYTTSHMLFTLCPCV